MEFSLWSGIPGIPCSLSCGLGSGLEAWSFIWAMTPESVGVVLLNQVPHSPWTPTLYYFVGVRPTYSLTLFLSLQGKGLPGPPVSTYYPLVPPKCVSLFPEQPSLKATLSGISQSMAEWSS